MFKLGGNNDVDVVPDDSEMRMREKRWGKKLRHWF